MNKKSLFRISYALMIVLAIFNIARETVFWNLYIQNDYQWLFRLVHGIEVKYEIIIVYTITVGYSVFLCVLNSKKFIKNHVTFTAMFIQLASLLASLFCFVVSYKASIGW